MSASTVLPRDIAKEGKINNGVWLAGIVVTKRCRKPVDPTADGGKAKGSKGKGKDKQKKSGKAGDGGAREGFEIHLCGGKTPADVIMLEAWDPAARQLLTPHFMEMKAFRITNIEIKKRGEKSTPWTTSRSRFFGVIGPDARTEAVERSPEWETYHPITLASSLQLLPDGRMVCAAGKILPPGPQQKTEVIAGERVAITNF